jgi:hypothetical protein
MHGDFKPLRRLQKFNETNNLMKQIMSPRHEARGAIIKKTAAARDCANRRVGYRQRPPPCWP